MHSTADSELIFEQLDERFEELAHYLYPGAPKVKNSIWPAAKGKDLGSFEIVIAGQNRGRWFRMSEGVGGHPIQLIAYCIKGDPTAMDKSVFDEARRFLGIERAEISPEERARREYEREQARRRQEERQRLADAEAARNLAKRQEDALWIWENADPIDGTAGERYLRGRGLHLDDGWPVSLRFAKRLRHQSGDWSSAIVARVSDAQDAFMGIWRIYVNDEGQKAFGPLSKMGLGAAAGGSVRLFEPINGEIGVCEGIEDAVAIRMLTRGRASPWCALSTSGLMNFEPPYPVARVRIFPDWNVWKRCQTTGKWLPPPGQTAAAKLAERLTAEAVDCVIEAPPKAGGDYNATLNRLQKRGLYQ